jgi:hypothetical protein
VTDDIVSRDDLSGGTSRSLDEVAASPREGERVRLTVNTEERLDDTDLPADLSATVLDDDRDLRDYDPAADEVVFDAVSGPDSPLPPSYTVDAPERAVERLRDLDATTATNLEGGLEFGGSRER